MTSALTTTQIAELVEFGEADAYADMFQAAPPSLGMSVKHIAGAVVISTSALPIALFNRVIGLGLREETTLSSIQTCLEVFRQAGAPEFMFQLSPAAQAEAPKLLATQGLQPRGNWAKMYRPATGPVQIPTELRVERIGPEHAADYAQVVLAAFGMPPFLAPWLINLVARPNWHHFMAFDGNKAVAASSLFVRQNIGWLGIGGTMPTHRRKGGQGALMAHRIQHAAALGCEWVITETGEDTPAQPNPSFHNMLRTGFQLAYLRANWALA